MTPTQVSPLKHTQKNTLCILPRPVSPILLFSWTHLSTCQIKSVTFFSPTPQRCVTFSLCEPTHEDKRRFFSKLFPYLCYGSTVLSHNVKFISYFVLWIATSESFQRERESESCLARWEFDWRLQTKHLLAFDFGQLVWSQSRARGCFLSPGFDLSFPRMPLTFPVSDCSPVDCWRAFSGNRTYSTGRGHCSLLLSLFGDFFFLASAVSFVLVCFYSSLSIFCIQNELFCPQSADPVIQKRCNMIPSGKYRCPKQVFGLV